MQYYIFSGDFEEEEQKRQFLYNGWQFISYNHSSQKRGLCLMK